MDPSVDVESGSTKGILNDFSYHNNVASASKQIRLAFIRKVYTLLSCQLLLTVVIAATIALVEPVKLFFVQNAWPSMTILIAYFVVFIALMLLKREHPTNLILLAGFTVLQAGMVGIIISNFDIAIVLEALFITLTIVISLTLFTFQSKWDFSVMAVALFAGLWVLLLGGILQIFIQSSTMEIFLCIGGALIFSLFIIFDTHLLMNHTSPEEYVFATISLYLDIINLFLYILRILAVARD